MEQNTISQLLEKMLQMYNNTLQLLDKTNDAITTDAETVKIDLYNSNLKTFESFQVPSFGYLKNSIKKLESNWTNILQNGSKTVVSLPDGSYTKLIQYSMPKPGDVVQVGASPEEFNTRTNEFFENFLNPLLYVDIPLNGVDTRTQSVYVERYIFDNNDLATISYFNDNLQKSGTISYEDFHNDVITYNLKLSVDSSEIKLDAKSLKYYGVFDVVDIDKYNKTQVINGVNKNVDYRVFRLNTLNYSAFGKRQSETESLKVGDFLVVNDGKWDTRYEITAIYSDTNGIEVRLIEGSKGINIGAGTLKYYNKNDDTLHLKLNTGAGQRQFVFIKTIDPDSFILSEEFSKGLAFDSNKLILKSDAERISLKDYYRAYVSDFGAYIKSLKVDYIPPAAVGLKPDAPFVSADTFKVTQINSHLTDNEIIEKIKKLNSNKISVESNIVKIDNEITLKRNKIASTHYSNTNELSKDKNELNDLLVSRSNETKLYNSILLEIKSISTSNNLKNITPKFRLRGFWKVPEDKVTEEGIAQKVVQFKVRYRYTSTSGTNSNTETITLENKTGMLSNWNEVYTTVRSRGLVNGKYEWLLPKEDSVDEISFNSIDIPIQYGELIELQVKSLSEAGFPSNPVESDWTNPIVFEFPNNELDFQNIKDILNLNEINSVKNDVISELNSQGLFEHLGDTLHSGEHTFHHSAEHIASGFLSENQTQLSLLDYLRKLQNDIVTLQEKLDNVKGEFKIWIEDEDGNVYNVENHKTLSNFSCNVTISFCNFLR